MLPSIITQSSFTKSVMMSVAMSEVRVVFSERTTLRSLYAISRPSVVCCLSVVCDVGAPYSGG